LFLTELQAARVLLRNCLLNRQATCPLTGSTSITWPPRLDPLSKLLPLWSEPLGKWGKNSCCHNLDLVRLETSPAVAQFHSTGTRTLRKRRMGSRTNGEVLGYQHPSVMAYPDPSRACYQAAQ